MRRVVTGVEVACLVAVVVLLPTAAAAQERASIVGVVQDSSGAVMPGVTVEASSPAMIEQVRSAVTDGSGRYAIIDLRPGTYAVTFTLTGFSTNLLPAAAAVEISSNVAQRIWLLHDTEQPPAKEYPPVPVERGKL